MKYYVSNGSEVTEFDLEAYTRIVREDTIDKLLKHNCADVMDDDCDGYQGDCYHCKYDKLLQRAREMRGTKHG